MKSFSLPLLLIAVGSTEGSPSEQRRGDDRRRLHSLRRDLRKGPEAAKAEDEFESFLDSIGVEASLSMDMSDDVSLHCTAVQRFRPLSSTADRGNLTSCVHRLF